MSKTLLHRIHSYSFYSDGTYRVDWWEPNRYVLWMVKDNGLWFQYPSESGEWNRWWLESGDKLPKELAEKMMEFHLLGKNP